MVKGMECKNLFTGWKDPGLTEQGFQRQKCRKINLRTKIEFDVMYTSMLSRAQKTGILFLNFKS